MDFAWPAVLSDADAFVAAAPGNSDLCDLLAALTPASVTAPGGLYAEMELTAAASQVSTTTMFGNVLSVRQCLQI